MKVYFGDNQFLGVNHLSEQKAIQQATRFSTSDAILETLEFAFESGADAFMCTTHERLLPVFESFTDQQRDDWPVIPCLPYAHKYSQLITEGGWKGLVQLVSQAGLAKLVGRGIGFAASSDATGLMKSLVDLELRPFKRMNTPAVFLQNAVTDLLLGLKYTDMLVAFYEYVRKEYQAEAGFITMNSSLLAGALSDTDAEKAWIAAPLNPIGFRMNPSKEAVETSMKSRNNNIAMSVLASGAVTPEKAAQYLSAQENVDAVLFGASSKGHIESSINLFRSIRS